MQKWGFGVKLLLNYPATWWKARWRDALLSGNGNIGAAVYGSVGHETIMLTHEDLWRGGVSPELPDISEKLSEVRRLLLADQVRLADRVLADELIAKGYRPKISWPLPLGDLKIKMSPNKGFKRYRRQLDMETGEVTVSWQDGDTRFRRSLFVSRPDHMVVYAIRADGSDLLDLNISLDLHDRNDAKRENLLLPDQLETVSRDQHLYYAATNDDGTDFGAVIRVLTKNGVLTAQKDGSLRVSDTAEVTMYIQLFVKGHRREQWNRLENGLRQIDFSYEQLLERHAEEHSVLFNAMILNLGSNSSSRTNEQLLLEAYQDEAPLEMIEKMWAYGRYLLLSSSRPGGHPCHLYGLWCGEYEGTWAFHMANENIQMIYWQALSGNMPDMMLPVFDYFDRLMDDFRTNAKRLYGCRGIYIPAPTVPDSGLLKHVLPHIMHWTGGAGWVAQFYYDYYLYTQDLNFLKERAIPFLRETALFYEDFFITGEDGYYMSLPSNSPENTPANYWNGKSMHDTMETTINATMDFAIAKEVLAHLIAGAEAVNLYHDEREKWQAMLRKIPGYQLNEDGAVREWMHPFFEDNYHHRHQSHLYPVFPGVEITKDKDPELFQAFKTAVEKRKTIGLEQQTGWSLAHMANNYARMGEGDLALECLNLLSRSCVIPNFSTLHNDWRDMGIGMEKQWAPWQIDANMGWSAAVQEMLLFSLPDHRIYILPALPRKWMNGNVGPLLTRSGVQVSLEWSQSSGTVLMQFLSPNRSLTITAVLKQPFLGKTTIPDVEIREEQICLQAGKVVNIRIEADKEIQYV